MGQEKSQKKGQKSGKGTHGSLSKAGKARNLNPVKNWREGRTSREGLNFRGKRKKIPRIRNRKRYEVATSCPACSGTDIHGVRKTPIKIGARKCWRCRARLEWRGMRPRVKERRRA